MFGSIALFPLDFVVAGRPRVSTRLWRYAIHKMYLKKMIVDLGSLSAGENGRRVHHDRGQQVEQVREDCVHLLFQNAH